MFLCRTHLQVVNFQYLREFMWRVCLGPRAPFDSRPKTWWRFLKHLVAWAFKLVAKHREGAPSPQFMAILLDES